MKINEVKEKVKILPRKFVLELTVKELKDLAGICYLVRWDTVNIANDIAYASDNFGLIHSPMRWNEVEALLDRV